MISRRKFLQGALGFASAAILPSGVIMPIKVRIEEPKITYSIGAHRIEPFNFYPDPEDNPERWGKGIIEAYRESYEQAVAESARALKERIDEDTLQAILDCRKAMDEANVPQNNRIIWRVKHVT